jgi:hypothetical protein
MAKMLLLNNNEGQVVQLHNIDNLSPHFFAMSHGYPQEAFRRPVLLFRHSLRRLGGFCYRAFSSCTGFPSSAPVATAVPANKPKVVVEKPFVPNEISAPRPNRRPGPALDVFRAMVQEIPSARA